MKVKILTDDIGNYDKELENKILNGAKELGARLVSKEEGLSCDAVVDISTVEDLIKYVKLHPYQEVTIFIDEEDESLDIAYCDLKEGFELRQYGMTEEEKEEEKKMFKALEDSTITYINDECDDYYCSTDSGVSFIPMSLQWDYV